MNIVDLSPRYATIVMGLCNTIGSFAGGLAPYAVQTLTEDGVSGWQAVLLITAGVQLLAVLVYLVMADTKLLDWNAEQQVNYLVVRLQRVCVTVRLAEGHVYPPRGRRHPVHPAPLCRLQHQPGQSSHEKGQFRRRRRPQEDGIIAVVNDGLTNAS